VRKELPYFVDKGYTWFITALGDRVIGCAAVEVQDDVGHFHHLWVDPDFRGNGVAHQLAKARLDYLGSKKVKLARAVVREVWVEGLESLGFRVISRRGSYSVMEKHFDLEKE
jgi:ribosomal protein S18 acetylase RimI-like enzyme